jgi:hypothetical protein
MKTDDEGPNGGPGGSRGWGCGLPTAETDCDGEMLLRAVAIEAPVNMGSCIAGIPRLCS